MENIKKYNEFLNEELKAKQSKLVRKLLKELPYDKRREFINALSYYNYHKDEEVTFEYDGVIYKISELVK